jgi:hypothetical protein
MPPNKLAQFIDLALGGRPTKRLDAQTIAYLSRRPELKAQLALIGRIGTDLDEAENLRSDMDSAILRLKKVLKLEVNRFNQMNLGDKDCG